MRRHWVIWKKETESRNGVGKIKLRMKGKKLTECIKLKKRISEKLTEAKTYT